MELTATLFLLIFVTIVTAQIQNFDMDLYTECMKDHPTLLRDVINNIRKEKNPTFLLSENDKNIDQLFDCQILGFGMTTSDKSLDYERLKPDFKEILSNDMYFKFPGDFDDLYVNCTANSFDSESVGHSYIKLYNCIVKDHCVSCTK